MQLTRLLNALGFSKGCAQLAPKNPPPLVPNCLTATIAATGPRAIFWMTPPSSVVASALPCRVIGMPLAMSSTPAMKHSGTKI